MAVGCAPPSHLLRSLLLVRRCPSYPSPSVDSPNGIRKDRCCRSPCPRCVTCHSRASPNLLGDLYPPSAHPAHAQRPPPLRPSPPLPPPVSSALARAAARRKCASSCTSPSSSQVRTSTKASCANACMASSTARCPTTNRVRAACPPDAQGAAEHAREAPTGARAPDCLLWAARRARTSLARSAEPWHSHRRDGREAACASHPRPRERRHVATSGGIMVCMRYGTGETRDCSPLALPWLRHPSWGIHLNWFVLRTPRCRWRRNPYPSKTMLSCERHV